MTMSVSLGHWRWNNVIVNLHLPLLSHRFFELALTFFRPLGFAVFWGVIVRHSLSSVDILVVQDLGLLGSSGLLWVFGGLLRLLHSPQDRLALDDRSLQLSSAFPYCLIFVGDSTA